MLSVDLREVAGSYLDSKLVRMLGLDLEERGGIDSLLHEVKGTTPSYCSFCPISRIFWTKLAQLCSFCLSSARGLAKGVGSAIEVILI